MEWSNGAETIFVHSYIETGSNFRTDDTCEIKASAAGYVKLPDPTIQD